MARYIVVLCLLCACVSKQESSIARRFIMENSATVGLPEGRIALIAKTDPAKHRMDTLGTALREQIHRLRGFQQIELVFLIDSSSSVGTTNFQKELSFVRKLLADFIVSADHARVALITFSARSRVIRWVNQLNDNDNDTMHKCNIYQHVLPRINYPGGATYTYGALMEAQLVLQQSRVGVKKVVFLLTDGYSNFADPVPAALTLQDDGVEIFTFGIERGNITELRAISSYPSVTHCYIVDSFDEFVALARRALHADLRTDIYIEQNATDCDDNCDRNATCHCGALTGRYQCLCNQGYYGSGGQCTPCPMGTYKATSLPGDVTSCMPCPDRCHTSIPGSISISRCTCRAGYELMSQCTGLYCKVRTCPHLPAPTHGNYVNGEPCRRAAHASCGLGCNTGYVLSGTSIRTCLSNGTWSGISVKCTPRTCDPPEEIQNGSVTCTSNIYVFNTSCQYSCNEGFKLVGQRTKICIAVHGVMWNGHKVECRAVTCKPLKLIVLNGDISPPSCASDVQEYGSVCRVSCEYGYKLQGEGHRQCQGTGQWSHDRSSTKCRDTTAPNITCPADITLPADFGSDSAVVTWSLPVASDNSGAQPSLSQTPVLEPPIRLSIGDTRILYGAEDDQRNRAECFFTVTILDKQPPLMENCMTPQTFIVDDSSQHRLIEPEFYDNSILELTTSQHPHFEYVPTHNTTVTYTATDDSGNNSTCQIDVIIEAEHCTSRHLSTVNNIVECEDTDRGKICSVWCRDGYEFALQVEDTLYSYCDYDTGLWNTTSTAADGELHSPSCSSKYNCCCAMLVIFLLLLFFHLCFSVCISINA